MTEQVLVRYGAVPEVARFVASGGDGIDRGQRVVIQTHRGLEMGTVLDRVQAAAQGESEEADAVSGQTIVRKASTEDEEASRALTDECQSEFESWNKRIRGWNLELELIDVEWTLDRQRQILYVLCDRGPDSTKLSLQAAANGFGTIHVQPVGEDGPLQVTTADNHGCGCGATGGCSR